MALIDGLILLEVQPSYLKPVFPPREILEPAVKIKGRFDPIFVKDGDGFLIENGSVINRENKSFHIVNGNGASFPFLFLLILLGLFLLGFQFLDLFDEFL